MNNSPQRILIIKLSSLGDIVHALPAVAALRQQFPLAHVTWLVKASWATILDGNPDIDDVWAVEFSLKNWPHLIRRLRKSGFDLVVDFQGLFRSGLLGRLAGAKRRVGFAQAREGAPWFYTHHVRLPKQSQVKWRLLNVHAVDRNLAVAGFLGATTANPVFHLSRLAEDERFIDSLFQEAKVASHEHLIALAPWSRSPIKSWPLARFVEVAQDVLKMPNVRIVVVGGPSDKGFADQFCALEPQGLVNLVGKLSLRQLPVLLSRMKLVVGNDSSLIHLAAGVGVPVLAIFGPTHSIATGPYPLDKHTVLRTDLPCSPCGKRTCENPSYLECLDSLTTTAVLEGIYKRLHALTTTRDEARAWSGNPTHT
jgi:lipopolysaccharide heptosyltransferase I